jgi:ABC-type antimicrobial peptide transport system permease subunit
LAAVGLYGVLSYSVTQKTREIGVRIALGARMAGILRLIMQQGLIMLGMGLAIGVAAALALSQLIAGILFNTSTTDFVSIGVSILVLCLTACLACVLPAVRAARINPITALRE